MTLRTVFHTFQKGMGAVQVSGGELRPQGTHGTQEYKKTYKNSGKSH